MMLLQFGEFVCDYSVSTKKTILSEVKQRKRKSKCKNRILHHIRNEMLTCNDS